MIKIRFPFFMGFIAKILSGLDDTAVHTPLITVLTKTRMGKFAFAIGMFLALLVVIFIADLISELLLLFPQHHIISAVILFVLAILIYFDVFIHIPRKRAEKDIGKLTKITPKRFRNLFFTGFFVFFATAIDDSIIFSSLLTNPFSQRMLIIFGIISAAILELIAIIYFSKKLVKLKYKTELTTIGILILGILILFKVI